jgi:hypothetical protein
MRPPGLEIADTNLRVHHRETLWLRVVIDGHRKVESGAQLRQILAIASDPLFGCGEESLVSRSFDFGQ